MAADEAVPGLAWCVDVYTLEVESSGQLGILEVAWNASETSVRYRWQEESGRVSIGRWGGSWHHGGPFPDTPEYKEDYSRTLYSAGGWMVLALGRFTDLSEGMDHLGRCMYVWPLTHLGVGVQYGGREYMRLMRPFTQRPVTPPMYVRWYEWLRAKL
jgi:hypothetical protein